MPTRTSVTGSELFIVDNSDDDWKAQRYLHDWCQISEQIDVATAYFEIGSLLSLDEAWPKTDKIRILMGDEVSLRTKRAFELGVQAITRRLNDSIESYKDTDDFLKGLPAIIAAMRSGKIESRVFRKDKFHAKAYITHARMDVVGSSALVGSSNFTLPGLTKNIELNVQITGSPVRVLQEWYEEHWEKAEDVTPELLRHIQKHVQEYPPFDVYAQSLRHLLSGEEMSDSEWERTKSVMFPILGKYQQDAYASLLKKARNYGGAFLCDGVGLGKTFVGLALIERLVERDRQRVALFVPKAARNPVWEAALSKYLPHLSDGYGTLKVFNHTDLLREGPIARQLAQVREQADVVVIDEAHHFRNTGVRGSDPDERQSRYWAMHDLCKGKQVYLLTATPVNNRMTDLMHMIELFSRNEPDHFARIGIHSLVGHFRKLENALRHKSRDDSSSEDTPPDTDALEAEQVLADDLLFREIVVQRSRAYVRESMQVSGEGDVVFPSRKPPQVAPYELKVVYGRVLDMVEAAFHKVKPLFSLPIYNPWPYYIGDPADAPDDSDFTKGRQKQVVTLIRTGFLKRLESSAAAFESSCWNLMQKLLAWVKVHSTTQPEIDRLEKWMLRHKEILGYEHQKQGLLFSGESLDDEDEDVIAPELLERVQLLEREQFNIPDILADTYGDLDQIMEFLTELRKFKPRNDSKLQALIKLLKTDPVLKDHKVLIFTEFMTTARYLEQQLKEAGIEGVAEIDSKRASSDKRGKIISRFAPYYNGSSPAELSAEGEQEIRVLISTDVLSEGLNLQDATRLINYDLHWNPVRLMQRIGRVDRRMNPETEARIKAEFPDRAAIRGEVAYWNFLPPDELNRLLSLYKTVAHKTLRISKTFGIEGKQLLTPDDDFDALRIFDQQYEGEKSPLETMTLKLEKLYHDHPGLEARLNQLPGRVFSGKAFPAPGSTPGSTQTSSRAVFFCYALPAKDASVASAAASADDPTPVDGVPAWSLDAGPTRWYLLDLSASGPAPGSAAHSTPNILESAPAIDAFISSDPDTPRHCSTPQTDLVAARKQIEKHIKNTYLKQVQAPLDSPKPKLIAWMELN